MVTVKKVEQVKGMRVLDDGSVLAPAQGKDIHVFGMLPGEEGIVELRKHKGKYYGELKELISSNNDRVEASELHYLSCSPWQILSYPLQVQTKRETLQRLYSESVFPSVDFVPADTLSRYRTKIEYSVSACGDDLSLSFHERGYRFKMISVGNGCMLASDAMNHGASALLGELVRLGYTEKDVKTIIMRESKYTKKVLGIVYLATPLYRPISWHNMPVNGGVAVYSDRRSPASITSQVLDTYGEQTILEKVDEVMIEYPWDGFFQNNIPMFKKVIEDIYLELAKDDMVLDLYSGAGTIGLCVADRVKEVRAVEVHSGSVDCALKNSQRNGITNYFAQSVLSEKIDKELITKEMVVVLDPPRAGLHPKLISTLLEQKPKKIIYLSCNPTTQARDISFLAASYSVSKICGYDFYPYTPHQESLAILNLAGTPGILPS